MSRHMEDIQTVGLVALGCLLAVAIAGGILISLLAGESAALRAQAVERGHAEWVVDPKTGATTWRWKP